MGRWFVCAASAALLGVNLNQARGQCSSCPSTQSGDIKVVRIPLAGGTPQVLMCVSAGTDFTVDLNNFANWGSNAGEWVLQVYDCASPATHNIGKVTISGNPSGLSSLAVLVAAASQAWDEDGRNPLGVGCVDTIAPARPPTSSTAATWPGS